MESNTNNISSAERDCGSYLLKQLRDQGLPLQKLHTVLKAIVLSRLMYALPAWGPLLNVELVHKIDGFLKRSFRYGFTNKLIYHSTFIRFSYRRSVL